MPPNPTGMFDKISQSFNEAIDNISAKSIKDKLVDGFKDKVKSTSQLDSLPAVPKPTDAILAHRQKESEAVLQQLASGYFTPSFDPVEFELQQLDNDAKQEDVDTVVERLTAAVEVVSGKLKRHVVQHNDKLIQGVSAVTSVEDDLKVAYLTTQATRSLLRGTLEDVERSRRVASQTRRKQGYLELLNVASKLQRAHDLQQSLRKAQESSDHGAAILLCVECFQGVDSLAGYRVAEELKGTVQRLYVDTLQRLDGALQNVCASFEPQEYSKVLEGYMLQGLAAEALSQKVLGCFKEALHDHSMRVVRSLVLSKSRLADALGSSSLEGSYGELCRSLPVDLLRPCLVKLMEVLFELLGSYYAMMTWHVEGCARQESLLVKREVTDTEAADASSAAPESDDAQLSAMEQATRSYLGAVANMLTHSRGEIWELAGRRVHDLLRSPNLFKAEDFLQVVEWCQKFVAVGDCFVGSSTELCATELRDKVEELCADFFKTYHRTNMDSLQTYLQTERWDNVGNSGPEAVLEGAARASRFAVATWDESGALLPFDHWLEAGNPFKRGGAVAAGNSGRKKKTASNADVVAADLRLPEPSGRFPSVEATSTPGVQQAQSSASPSQPGSPSSPSPSTARRATSEVAGSSGRSDGKQLASRMQTVLSQQVLKWLRSYCELMGPLRSRAQSIFRALWELFDSYLLSTFIWFGGINLQRLVWDDDVLPNRLRSTLMRICSADGSKHQTEVQQLLASKPVRSTKDELPSLLDSSINEVGLTIKTFANKFKDAMAEIEKTGSGPAPGAAAAGSSGSNRSTAQQQQQQGAVGGPGGSTAGGSIPSGPSGASASSSSGPGTGGRPHNLKQRVVAVESLLHVAEQLRAAKSAMQSALPGALDSEFLRTVDATQDLKECIIHGGAKGLMRGMLDPERGTAALVAATNYSIPEPPTSQNGWANDLVRHFQTFRDAVAACGLPPEVVAQLWEAAATTAAEAILDGLGAIRRCTAQGRDAMSYDLSFVEHSVRKLACPPPAPGTTSTPQQQLQLMRFERVRNYIKAFYTPWAELAHWGQIHLPEYGKGKVLVLVENVAELYKIKKQQKRDLLAKIDPELAEYA